MRDRDFASTCTVLVVQQACGQMARGGLLCSAYKTMLTAQTHRTLQLVGRPEDALAVMSVTRVVLAVTVGYVRLVMTDRTDLVVGCCKYTCIVFTV